MAKRKTAYRQAQAQTPRTTTADSFQNLTARVGLGTQNQNSASQYGFSPISRDRNQLELAYRSSWIVGQAVDVYAEDMTREGVEVKGDIKPDQMEELERGATALGIWNAFCDTVKWARLYGGCIAMLMIDGQDVSTPLRLETITKGQFKGLLVLDRWMVQPSLQDLITEYGPNIGKPKYYQLGADTQGLGTMNIHHSRCVRIDGVDLPHWQRISENGWGQSVVERLWDRIIPFDSATQGTAQLVFKAHLRTYKVNGLRELIAAGGKALEGLAKQMEMVRQYQSNEGLTLMDASDDFEAHSYTFAGLNDVLLQSGQQISGALGIPLVRLFGQSPAGLNSTGEADMRNYYDNVKKDQEKRLRSGVSKVYGVLYRSVFGTEPPVNFTQDFKPLWQLSDEQRGTITNQVTTSVVGAYEAQIIDRATALKELRQSSQITGVFSNVTDEDIKQALNDPPPGSELDLPPDANLDPDTGPSDKEATSG